MAVYNITRSEDIPARIIRGDILNFLYTGTVIEWKPFMDTVMEVNLWGAAGGHGRGTTNTAGRGGTLRVFEFKFRRGNKYFFVVGGKGQDNNYTANALPGGYNGGGDSSGSGGNWLSCSGSGGGATDIREGENTIDHRIMIAGGGGGGFSSWGHYLGYGGHGGGLEGGSVKDVGGRLLQGGTQTSGYMKGKGQNGVWSSASNSAEGRAGAGGGYWGGRTHSSSSWQFSNSSGPGGSGYKGDLEGIFSVAGKTDNGLIRLICLKSFMTLIKANNEIYTYKDNVSMKL